MFLWLLKQLPIRTIADAVVFTDALQLMGIGFVGMGLDLLLDLLGVSDWSGDRFGSLL